MAQLILYPIVQIVVAVELVDRLKKNMSTHQPVGGGTVSQKALKTFKV